MDQHVAVEDTNDINQALTVLLAAAGKFLMVARLAHLEQQPEHAQAVGMFFAHGAQPGIRLQVGLAPHVEAGVMHEGAWEPWFRWQPPIAAPDPSKAN